MKRLAALVALVLAVPLLAAPRDWSATGARGATGAFVIGNPAARAKLVEYVSYVCPHCAHFSQESAALKTMVANGSTSLEVRALVQNQVDLAAALTARCAGPARFLKVNGAIFAAQDAWYRRAADYVNVNAARLESWPATEQVKAIVVNSGLVDIAAAQGVAKPALATCIADPATLATVLKVDAAARPLVQGTPTLVLNGRKLEGHDWSAIEPQLRAAGAR